MHAMMMKSDRREPHPFRPLGLLILAVTAAAVALWALMPQRDGRRDNLAAVQKWTYQLQGFAGDMDRARQSDSDMLVIDYAIDDGRGMRPLTRQEVDALKRKPDGARRLVIAYFSVGEAEEYRPYWKAEWKAAPPGWIIAENCRWPKNHLVKFWEDGWRDIIFAGQTSYLAAIQDAGFDGVYLDRVDVYGDLADRFAKAGKRMVKFVKDLAEKARERDPGFLVIVQNAEELLANSGYRAAIDSVAKEDLLYGVNGTGQRNPDDMIEGSVDLLNKLEDNGKPVFAVEYLTARDAVSNARRELDSHGYVGVFPSRALDGKDPVAMTATTSNRAGATPHAEGDEAPKSEPEVGTPEYAAAKCDGVWKRAKPEATPEAAAPAEGNGANPAGDGAAAPSATKP